MQIDKITISDVGIFHSDEDSSIFERLNFTRTIGGREWLRRFFSEPHHELNRIVGVQNIIKTLLNHIDDWPKEITNGTVIMMDKFLDYNLDPVPRHPTAVNGFTYRMFNQQDYSMIKFSIKHFADFFRGVKKILQFLSETTLPANLSFYLDRIKTILSEVPLQKLADTEGNEDFSPQQNLYYAHYVRRIYKTRILDLIDVYSRLEAWYSMAMAVQTYQLKFPEFIEQDEPYFNAEGLYHILLQRPTSYDLVLEPSQNFLFLTGANMAGKSTLIKAVGSAVFLAHLGMGVPAKTMRLSVFDGLLTNINVFDNIAKGESYFFNEVQRIKSTIFKINDGKKWLVLIDELFKGTNVQDAMKCSLTVIKGLIKIKSSLFILSTHLYEIGEELQGYSNIAFRYFETIVLDDQLEFSYQLKPGISDDRIGYVILRREKVVEMLEKLPSSTNDTPADDAPVS
jgi:DNA mismatch repair ATPase MutS